MFGIKNTLPYARPVGLDWDHSAAEEAARCWRSRAASSSSLQLVSGGPLRPGTLGPALRGHN
eukprot:8205260-Alexandrium_andersonii.AAC.1